MTNTQRNTGLAFNAAIFLGAAWILSPFLLAMLWSVIIAVSCWPLHARIKHQLHHYPSLSALMTTLLVGLLIVGPMVLIAALVTQDMLSLSNFMMKADKEGLPAPDWLHQIPAVGDYIHTLWQKYLAQPDQLSMAMKDIATQKINTLQQAIQIIIASISERLVILGLALWMLFFLLRDGLKYLGQLNNLMYRQLAGRWTIYVRKLPDAIRGTVNGLVLVGMLEAIALAALFYTCEVPSPVLLGMITATFALVPMLAPMILFAMSLLLFAHGDTTSAIILISIGHIIVFGADYIVRPLLITGKTNLPFSAVLLGIFGGVYVFGIVGLIIGPVLLVLLLVLIDELVHSATQTPLSDQA
jgi:predicted PurR-regulated permease PerM